MFLTIVMSKLATVLFLERPDTCICAHAFFAFKEQDTKHIIAMEFIIIRIDATPPWKAAWDL